MKALDYIFAARPMLHLPIWSIYLVALHYHLRLSGERFQWSDLGMMICLSLIATGGYYLNQVYDYETDRINRKLGFLQGSLVSESALIKSSLVISVVMLVLGSLISPAMLFVFAQLVLLGYLYSAPPARLKDRPVTGLLVNAYGIGFLMPIMVMPEINLHNMGLLGWDNPAYFFLAVGAVYLLTTLPDRIGDRATGKRTPAAVLPGQAVKLASVVLLLLAALVADKSGRNSLAWLALVSLVPVGLSLVIHSRRLVLLAAKLPVLFLTMLAGYFFPWYFVFVVLLLVSCRLYYWKRFNLSYPQWA